MLHRQKQPLTGFIILNTSPNSLLSFGQNDAKAGSREKGAKRDILMLAGWYAEEITAVLPNKEIRYRVFQSFPKVRQDFTAITFEEISDTKTRVTWKIEISVPLPIFSSFAGKAAGKMAQRLYATILTAGKKELERDRQ